MGKFEFSTDKFLTSEYPFEDIYGREWIEELLDVIKNDKSVEDFIISKDTLQRAKYLAKSLKENTEKIDDYNQQIDEANTKISKLQEEKSISDQLSVKIDNISSLLPKNKQALFQKAVSECFNNSDTVTQLFASEKGFKGLIGKFNNIINNKKIKQTQNLLTDLMQYMKDNNIIEKVKESPLLQATISGKNTRDELNKIEASIVKEQNNVSYLSENKSIWENKNKEKSGIYDSIVEIENNNIREFVKQKGPYIKFPPTISKEEIATNGLSEDFIEGQIMQSKYPAQARTSLRRFYEGLDRPAAPMVAFSYGKSSHKFAQDEVITQLRKNGINAVADTDERAKDPTAFVVTQTSVQAPFMAPEEALKANIKIIESICQAEHADRPYLSNPLTREALCMAAEIDRDRSNVIDTKSVAMNNGCNYQEITKGDFEGYVSSMLNEAAEEGKSPNDLDKENSESYNNKGVLKSVFHGGKCSDPYAVLCAEDNMNFVYAAGSCDPNTSTYKYNTRYMQPDGALGYSLGKSSHNHAYLEQAGIQYGFLFEYESRGIKQEFIGIDRAGGQVFEGGKFDKDEVRGSHDETTVLAHQNKLKTAYVVTKKDGHIKVLPLEIDENGQIKDKKWRDFMDLHKPIDDNLKGFMIERRNNMIADYDHVGKEKYMNRTLEDINSGKIQYVASEKHEFKKADSIVKSPIQGNAEAISPQPQPQVQQPTISNEQSMQYDKFVATNAGAKLRVACTDMLNKEPDKYAKIVRDWNAQYNADPAHPENAVNNVLATYKQDLMPYVETVMKFEQYDKFMENDSYKKLYSACMDMKDKDQATYNKVVRDWNAQYNANPAQHGTIVQNIIAKYKQDLMPYVEPAMNDAQTATLSNSLEGQTYSSMSNNDKKTFVTALRTGDNMISGEGFKEATAHIQPNVAQAMINVQTATLSNSQEEQAYGSMSNNDKKTFVTALRTGDNMISGEGFRKTTAHIQPQQTNTYADKSNLSFAQMQQKSSSGRE